MNSVVGFTVFSRLSESRVKALEAAQDRALAHFPDLQKRSLVLGETHLELWGRGAMDERIHTLPDGSLAVVIGSPHGKVVLKDIQYDLLSNEFEIPWDGRVILLRISPDGKGWTIWNDWLGSIPVFHTTIEQGRIASTLEPVTVAAAGYTPEDFFLPGLVSLLINGHFISDWTLYKDMKAILPDSMMKWDEKGFRAKSLCTVEASQSRWEVGWDDLVDEMYALSHRAIADVLRTQPGWILPLSAGLDSRLIAAVGADLGTDLRLYAWGERDSTDVVYSRQIAHTLGFPWKHMDLPRDFLVKYTPLWADLFGSSMHFHGMYQMSFLDLLKKEPAGPVLTGFLGDMLSGASIGLMEKVHSSPGSCQIFNDWYVDWSPKDLQSLKEPVENICPIIASAVESQINAFKGTQFQKLIFLALWSRLRFFNTFQSALCDYWRGVADPFLNRAYARFAMSLPRAALDNRRLLADVYRRYYGRLAVIPGTYAKDPFILTGKYLFRRRIVKHLPAPLHHGPFAGLDEVPLRMDVDCIQSIGKDALWPLFEAWDQVSEWLDVNRLEQAYQAIMRSKADIRPLRKLQAAQTLAYRLQSSTQFTSESILEPS
jgi:hypothetical protein